VAVCGIQILDLDSSFVHLMQRLGSAYLILKALHMDTANGIVITYSIRVVGENRYANCGCGKLIIGTRLRWFHGASAA
jgi:hypothetical protein